MSVIVTDTGFGPDDWTGELSPHWRTAAPTPASTCRSDTDPARDLAGAA